MLGFLSLAKEGLVSYVEDILTVSRRRWRDAANLYRLQVWMLQTICPLLARASGLKRTIQELENTTPPSGDSRLADARRDLHGTRTAVQAIRAVGDGIVWRLLGHDRATYHVLGQGHSPGHMGEQGLDQELASLGGQVGKEKGVPVMCSLTNMVRVGDLIVFSEEEDEDNEITLVEVKTKKGRSPRVKRQKQRLRQIVTMLDEREGRLHETEFRIVPSAIPQETYLPPVANLIQHAAKGGSHSRTLDDHLQVECHVLDAIGAGLHQESEGIIAARY